MVPSDYIIANLATLMYNEPKDDAILGYTLCGLVVRNRVLAGWQGGQWLKLIAEHQKYSAEPSPRSALLLGDPNFDRMFLRVLSVAANIFAGHEKDISAGALYYGRLNECSDQFKENIVRQTVEHPLIGQVGRNSLFK